MQLRLFCYWTQTWCCCSLFLLHPDHTRFGRVVAWLIADVAKSVQITNAAVIGCQPADLSGLHHFTPDDGHRVLKTTEVPALEQGHVYGNMAGRNTAVLLNGFIELCQFR